MNSSLRSHFLLLFAAIAVLGGAAGYRFYAWYSGEITTVLGQRFAERNVLYEKSRVLAMVTREVTLVQKMADSQRLRDWTASESSPARKHQALIELEEYRRFLRDHSYFFAHAASGNYYFNDQRGEHDINKPRYTLDPANPKDAWFYLTLRDVKDTQLNVDTDRATGLTKVWINTVVRGDNGEAVAVAGSGVDISDFIKHVVNSDLPGAISILMDRHGAIQGHPDVSMIDFASLRKAAGNEVQRTFFDLLDNPDNPDDAVSLRQAMAVLADGKGEVATLDLVVQGQRQLIGVTWLPQIQWYVLTMTSPAGAGANTKLASAVLWLIAALTLILLAAMLIFQRTVIRRVIRLDQAASAMSEGGHVAMPADALDDEIGRLGRTFRTMAERIAEHTEDLEHQVAERTEMLEKVAYTDFLTGAMNRRGVLQRLEKERNRLAHTGGLLAVMIIDVDHFKRINDTWGHGVGDQALIAVASLLQTTVRDYDLVARWGGEEFLVALFGLNKFDELEIVADKLLAAIRQHSLDCGTKRIELTYSIGGVVTSPQAALDAIVHQADAALYRAKNEGRNRAVLDCLMVSESACKQPNCQGDGKACLGVAKEAGS
jgi:diguanylate cyclase (GGDEF)-like protein